MINLDLFFLHLFKCPVLLFLGSNLTTFLSRLHVFGVQVEPLRGNCSSDSGWWCVTPRSSFSQTESWWFRQRMSPSQRESFNLLLWFFMCNIMALFTHMLIPNMNTPKEHWGCIVIRSLGPHSEVWPHSFSSVNANVSLARLRTAYSTDVLCVSISSSPTHHIKLL